MRGLTAYQLEVLRLAQAGNPAGEGPIDFDQVLDRLSWSPSKQSAQFTIRACIAKKVLEKTDMVMRRGRRRVCYQLTEQGRLALDPRGPVPAEVGEGSKGLKESVTTDIPRSDAEKGVEDDFRELPGVDLGPFRGLEL
jgi:hypothetical protein